MDEVVLALEGVVAPMSCFVDDTQEGRVLCSHVADDRGACATRLLWTRVQGGVMEKLAETTLAELVAFAGGPAQASRPSPPPSSPPSRRPPRRASASATAS